MTIGDRIEAHLTQANEIDTSSRLEKAHWQAAYDVLSKLQDIKQDAAWLARNLQELVERIDRDGESAVINKAGLTGGLADRINLSGAELAGLRSRLQTLESLSRES